MAEPVVERMRLTSLEDVYGRRVPSVRVMVLASFCGACLTGLLAQLRFPLPFTPVPVTGQVLAVLVCGSLLGSGYGTLSQAIYVMLGASGVPWFAGGTHGLAVIFGPAAVTGGYLVGFMVAALFLGTCTERSAQARTLVGQLKLMLFAVALIYLFGALHLMLTLRVSLGKAFAIGVAPFVLADALKVLVAALLTSTVLSRRRESTGERR